MNTLHWVVWVHAHACKNRSWVFILNSSSEFVGYENSPKKRCTSSFTFPSSSYHSRNESLIITLLNLWGLWIWVQSTNPLPCSCQNACHPDILISFKLLSISPSLRAGLLFDENLYCKHLVMQPPLGQTVCGLNPHLNWLQYSLADLHQLSTWPNVFLRPKWKISWGFAWDCQDLARGSLFGSV